MSGAYVLRDCPCCGSPAEIDTRQGYRGMDGKHGEAIAVYCTGCSLTVSICKEDVPGVQPEEVVQLWNRRPAEGATTPSHCPELPIESIPVGPVFKAERVAP
jgi:hypothetical protein